MHLERLLKQQCCHRRRRVARASRADAGDRLLCFYRFLFQVKLQRLLVQIPVLGDSSRNRRQAQAELLKRNFSQVQEEFRFSSSVEVMVCPPGVPSSPSGGNLPPPDMEILTQPYKKRAQFLSRAFRL